MPHHYVGTIANPGWWTLASVAGIYLTLAIGGAFSFKVKR